MAFKPVLLTALFCLTLGVLQVGCEHEHEHKGEPSGAICPTTNAPTYNNFGRTFMATYCTRCHSSTLRGADRNGAAKGHDFDSQAGVLTWIDHVDLHAAAGPNGINDEMPPSAPLPGQDEREKLGQWLACEKAKPDGGAASAEDGASLP